LKPPTKKECVEGLQKGMSKSCVITYKSFARQKRKPKQQNKEGGGDSAGHIGKKIDERTKGEQKSPHAVRGIIGKEPEGGKTLGGGKKRGKSIRGVHAALLKAVEEARGKNR